MVTDFASALSAIFTSERARLLHVVVPAHAHGHTLALLRALGEAGSVPRPVWVLADPTYGPSRGWAARERSLLRDLRVPAPGAAPGGEPSLDAAPGGESSPYTAPGDEPPPYAAPGGESSLGAAPGGESSLGAAPGGESSLGAAPGGESSLGAAPGGEPSPDAVPAGDLEIEPALRAPDDPPRSLDGSPRSLDGSPSSFDGAPRSSGDPLGDFARALEACLVARGPAAGVVLVLAPQHIDDPPSYARDLFALVQRPGLARVRWVVVDAMHSSVGALVERLGAGASRVIWPEAENAALVELDRMLTDLSARGHRLPADLEIRIPAGSPLRAPEAVPIRRLLHEADKCFQVGRFADAARLQHQAEEALAARGLGEEGVHVAMQRARSLIAAGVTDEGHRVFVAALKEAERRGLLAIVPEAYASLGSLHSKQRRFLDAAEAYARAGELADRRGSPEFAADMHRCAGHAALNADMPDAAAKAWRRAFELLGSMVPLVGALEKPQQIVVLGLALADAFELHGNLPAARGLRGHAQAIEERNPRRSESWS